MTPQEIFNTVATHLFTQGEKAVGDDNRTCRYRGTNGRKCAVGCLISDELYDPNMEDKNPFFIKSNFSVPAWFTNNLDLLSALQSAHDSDGKNNWQTTADMRRALVTVATKFTLDSSILKPLSFENR